jgi:hypothetical protein
MARIKTWEISDEFWNLVEALNQTGAGENLRKRQTCESQGAAENERDQSRNVSEYLETRLS